jgi:hypothetical protein
MRNERGWEGKKNLTAGRQREMEPRSDAVKSGPQKNPAKKRALRRVRIKKKQGRSRIEFSKRIQGGR